MYKKFDKGIGIFLGFLMVLSFFLFAVGEMTLPSENSFSESSFRLFEADWVEVLPDGGTRPIEVPGSSTTPKKEWLTIQTILPRNQQDTWICMRSMQQDVKIYVGEELRKEYSTLETQPVGKTSTMTYLFFELLESDAGKPLRIELMTDSFYSGYVSEMYMGEVFDIMRHFIGMYAPSFFVAALMFLMGLLVIGGSIFVQFIYKRKIEVIHLGCAILVAATWLMVESKLRQFIFPNATMAMLMGFLMIGILPYPIMSYINSVQNYRYGKAYRLLACAVALNFVYTGVLQLLGVKDFFETMTSSHIVIVALVAIMAITILTDIIKGYVREYREVAIGFAALMAAGICEVALTYMVSTKINGIALCAGLVVLLAAAGLKTVRDVVQIEREKQKAISASESSAKFLANMSHEIRTPINAVIGMNEMILRESKDEAITEYAYNIKNASRMLLGIINDILDFSKIEAGKLQIVPEEYELGEMLNDVVQGISLRANEKNLELVTRMDETMPSVLLGDEIRIKQILNNLLSNAVKYTEKGRITLEAQGIRDEKGFSLKMSVKDTGVGIKKEDMGKLFDSFQRLDLKRNRYIEGTGLGMNIVKQLVSGMNGSIEVQSEYGVGSCFTVLIPQQIINETAMGPLGQRSRKPVEKSGEQKKVPIIPDAKILVVDDTRMNLTLVKGLLKRTQAQLDFAISGNECLEMTKKKTYDLILMDHMMPEPDGVQTMHMIREDKDNLNQKVPIVVLTANALSGMKEEYLQEGFADYISKPIEVDNLE